MDKPHDQRKPGERIAKVIARAGLASRRAAEAWIAAGRVAVNGTVIASPALDVMPSDHITVDGAPLPARERTRLFLYHKPRGLMTTHADPQGRPTIFQSLPGHLPRLISVGRLDFNSEGLLLLTNDGALARLLELPATGWLRRYRVRAHGSIGQNKLDGLRQGVTISGIHYGPIEAVLDRVQGSNVWLTVAFREGKNREVRNVLGHLGLTVTRLIRVSYGPFQLGELAEGAVEEVPTRTLREQLGERLASRSGADFAAPRAMPRQPSRQQEPFAAPAKPPAKAKERNLSDHAWRAQEDGRPAKKLRRRFHGARQDPSNNEPRPKGQARTELLTDRKGRMVAVERYPTVQSSDEAKTKAEHGKYPKHDRPRQDRPDRISGRKHRPRGRR